MQEKIKIEKFAEYSGHISSIYGLIDQKDSPYFYSAGGDGWIVRWNKDGSENDGILIAKTDAKIFSITYIESHKLIVAGDMNGHIYWIDLESNSIISRVDFHKKSVFGFKILNKNEGLSYSGDGYICFWDIDTRQPKESIKISNHALRCVEMDFENQKAYIGSSDHHVYIFDLIKREVIQTIKNHHQNSIFSLSLLDKNRLISGGRDALLNIMDTQTFEKTYSFAAHLFTINRIVNIPEFKIFVTASRDKTFRIWDSENYALLKSIDVFKEGHVNSINSILYCQKNQHLITAGDDRMIKIWKLTILEN